MRNENTTLAEEITTYTTLANSAGLAFREKRITTDQFSRIIDFVKENLSEVLGAIELAEAHKE